MQTGRLRANNSDDHYTDRIQIKGRMQLKDSVQTTTCLRAKAAINSQIQDTRCHRFNNSSRKHYHQSTGSGNLPSQTIPNPRGNASVARPIPVPFPSRTLSTRKPESDEELLKMFRKVEINIPLLDAIKQIPKYPKFLKELCVHKRKKMKGGVELGGIVSALTKNDNLIVGTRQALPKKC
ncbi:hypothetical protein CR513_28242, partial [Mucuna pruriens]